MKQVDIEPHQWRSNKDKPKVWWHRPLSKWAAIVILVVLSPLYMLWGGAWLAHFGKLMSHTGGVLVGFFYGLQ